MVQQTLSGFIVDRSRAETSKREQDVRANVTLDQKREQAVRLGLAWPEEKRSRGKPSRQQLYAARLYRHIREGELVDGVTSQVPMWWKPGSSWQRAVWAAASSSVAALLAM
eukprot:5455164-Amphidinium_carterae.1